jgi:hypothetical protein
MIEPADTSHPPRSDDTVPLEIGYDEIIAAYQTGAAAPLSRFITDIVRYRDHWWIAHTTTWLLITDAPTIGRLDRHTEWADAKLLRDPTPND